MGVHGLWDLLSPVGRRVSVETLAGKRLAIDASIWLVQFVKAMRDEKGEMVRNAHLLGFFRRICKLLFLRTKPVFVFDGGTPALKRRTVVARRRQRENAQAKVRKTAEKLLLNQLKAMGVKELTKELDIHNMKKGGNGKGKKVVLDEANSEKEKGKGAEICSQEMADEMLAASLAAEEHDALHRNAGAASTGIPQEDLDDEEIILPFIDGNVDPAVLAALPPSMQLDLLVQMRERLKAENREKYQQVKKAPQRFSELQIEAYLKTVAFRREIDVVQKAAAGKGVGGVQTARIASEADREFIFSSSFTGDKQLLTSDAVKNPDKSKNEDSSLNIESIVSSACQTSTSSQASRYKVVMGVRNNNHRPLVGAHVSRRRAMGIHMTRDLQRNLDLMKEFEQDNITANLAANAPRGLDGREPHSDSISGVNGENCLSLSEKHDQNVSAVNKKSTLEISFEDNELRKPLDGVDEFFVSLAAGTPVNFSLADDTLLKDQNLGSSADCEKKGGIIGVQAGNLDHESDAQPCNVGASNDSNEDELEWVDGTANVPEASANLSFSDVTLLEDKNLGSPADCEWEEGIIGVSVGNPSHDLDGQPSNVEASEDNDEDELEWEDDISTACVEYLRPVELKPKSRGSLEEEAALQEAVRRSLEDLQADNLTDLSDKRKMTNKIVHLVPDGPFEANNETSEIRLQLNDDSVAVDSSSNLVCQSQFSDGMVGIEAPETTDLEMRRKSCASVTGEIKEVQTDKHSAAFQHLDVEGSVKNAEASCSVATYVEGSERSYERICDMSSVISETSVSPGSTFLTESSQLSFKSMGQSERENFLMCNSRRTHEDPKGQKEFLKESSSLMNEKGKVAEKEFDNDLQEPACNADIPWSTFEEGGTGIEVPGTSFEDELQNLGEELINLEDEQRKLERNADFMNSEMFVECQELLHMFGIPYIIAPMEAEAQCAYMECADLVDGVVTDDSDVFLFGARSVYKNIFDDRKYVETYFMKDMEDELGLTREKLIRMAMLLGSDYTEGVSGIGIVNAIEVVTAFPEEDGLSKFREWIESPDPNILSPWGMQQSEAPSNNKAPMSVSDSDVNTLSSSNDKQNEDKLDTDSVTKTRKTFMNKHRNVSKNWHIPPSFPSQSVVDAYNCPQVDKSTEPFSWGKPDLFVLRRFSWEKFGWDSQKVNELLLPVLQEYNKRETQLRLEAFYSFNERFAKIRSKRIKQAVKGLTVNSPSKKKIAGGDSVDDNVDGGNKVSKRKGRAHKEVRPSEGNKKRKKSDDGSEGDGRVRQKTRAGRGKRKASPVSKSCDSGQSNAVHEAQVESFDGCSSGLRRSKRSRKACKYTEDEKEVVELLNDDDPTGLNTETSQQESVGVQCFDPDFGHEDFNNIEDHFVEESLLDQGLHEGFDALNDGGFLANDADEVIAGDGLMLYDSSVKVDGSYLETGGGFCIGEDDDTNNISLEECDPNPENNSDGSKEAAGMSVSDAEDEMEVDNSRGASGIASGKLREQVTVFSDFEQDLMPEPANRGGNLPRINDSDIQGSTSSTPEAFRAMPYLRKKRKS